MNDCHKADRTCLDNALFGAKEDGRGGSSVTNVLTTWLFHTANIWLISWTKLSGCRELPGSISGSSVDERSYPIGISGSLVDAGSYPATISCSSVDAGIPCHHLRELSGCRELSC